MPARVSVIMSAYNCSAYVVEAVESILQQSFTDFELIIVDDQSSDGTWEILQALQDPRIRLFRMDTRSGSGPARNRALAEACGEYIVIMDADDIAHADRLQLLVGFMDANPQFVMCGSAIDVFGDRREQRFYPPRPVADFLLLTDSKFSPVTLMARRDIVVKYSITYPDIARAQDWVFIYRLARCGPVASLPLTLTRYRMHGFGVGQKSEENLAAGRLAAMKLMLFYCLGRNVQPREVENYAGLIMPKRHKAPSFLGALMIAGHVFLHLETFKGRLLLGMILLRFIYLRLKAIGKFSVKE